MDFNGIIDIEPKHYLTNLICKIFYYDLFLTPFCYLLLMITAPVAIIMGREDILVLCNKVMNDLMNKMLIFVVIIWMVDPNGDDYMANISKLQSYI